MAANAVIATDAVLVETVEGEDGVAVVGGAVSLDGMCRPDPYQYFVFVRGRFAGTLSPRLMRARADGSVNKVSFAGPRKIVAAFSRYTDADPLCSRRDIEGDLYQVAPESGKPVVRLIRVQTQP